MGLSAKWFQHLRKEETKQSREETVRAGSTVLDLLTQTIEGEILALEKSRTSDYDNPNWAYKQAHLNGQIQTLRNLLTLTKLGD